MTRRAQPRGHVVHAGCVALGGRGALITGASGSGKSGLALQLLALGAELVADDRTLLTRDGDALIATCPEPIRGQIEARGIGILHLPARDHCPVCVVVDMDRVASERMPDPERTELLDLSLPVIKKSGHAHFPAAILLYLRHGRMA